MGYTDYHQLESYYTERLLNIAKELSKKVIVWQGNLNFFLSSGTIDKKCLVPVP